MTKTIQPYFMCSGCTLTQEESSRCAHCGLPHFPEEEDLAKFIFEQTYFKQQDFSEAHPTNRLMALRYARAALVWMGLRTKESLENTDGPDA